MTRAIVGFLLVFVLGACGAAHPLTVPDDFVVLEDDYADYDLRATNAHGAVMSVRAIDNDVEGNLSFWVDAVKNKLRTQGGYALLDEGEIRAASGQAGHQLRFGRDQNGQAYQYWVSLFVTPDTIWLVEAGGRGEVWEQAAPKVERSIATLTID